MIRIIFDDGGFIIFRKSIWFTILYDVNKVLPNNSVIYLSFSFGYRFVSNMNSITKKLAGL